MAIERFSKVSGSGNNYFLSKPLNNRTDSIKTSENVPVGKTETTKESKHVLPTDTAYAVLGIQINKGNGTKIDKDFWGDALNGLKLKDTTLSLKTTNAVKNLGKTFEEFHMQHEIENSPFMRALDELTFG